MAKISKDSSLYSGIFEDIMKNIQEGKWSIGDRLPTEKELINIYGVSRTPVRQALEKLKNLGVVKSKQGKGTFVTDPRVRAKTAWKQLTGFSHYYIDNFHQINAKLLSISSEEPPKTALEHLNIEPGTRVLTLERLRKVNDTPVGYIKHYLSKNIKITKEEIEKNKDFISISAFLEEHGFYVSEVQERIYAKKANSKIASLLNISEGSSLLWINRYSFDAARRPLDYVEYYIVDDRWHYLVSFTR